jgi:hypothetical protein
MLPSKGTDHFYNAHALKDILQVLGIKKAVIKSDSESSLVALIQQVKDSSPGLELTPEHSPVGEHQANGVAERACRSVQGLA